jgi:hypothetical protein
VPAPSLAFLLFFGNSRVTAGLRKHILVRVHPESVIEQLQRSIEAPRLHELRGFASDPANFFDPLLLFEPLRRHTE